MLHIFHTSVLRAEASRNHNKDHSADSRDYDKCLTLWMPVWTFKVSVVCPWLISGRLWREQLRMTIFFHSNVPVFFFPAPNRSASKFSCAFWDVSLHCIPLFSSVKYERKPVVSFLLADAAHFLAWSDNIVNAWYKGLPPAHLLLIQLLTGIQCKQVK